MKKMVATLLVSLLTTPTGVLGQGAEPTDGLEAIARKPGRHVRLLFKDQTEIQGTLVEVRQDAVILENSVALKGPAQPDGLSPKGRRPFLRVTVASAKLVGRSKAKWIGIPAAAAGIGLLLFFEWALSGS
jgi:hypothetical protein